VPGDEKCFGEGNRVLWVGEDTELVGLLVDIGFSRPATGIVAQLAVDDLEHNDAYGGLDH
jgi:hypothetical protein